MTFRDAFLWVFTAVLSQRSRSALSILGIAIGIFAVVLLNAMGEGFRQYVMAEFTQFGTRIVAITPGKTETHGLSGLLATKRPLSLADAEHLKSLSFVESVIPVTFGSGLVKAGSLSRYTSIAGVAHGADKAWVMQVAEGAFLPDEDWSRPRPYVVLGHKVKQELFGVRKAVGEWLHVGGKRFRIVGVMAPKGQFLGTDMDDLIFIPAQLGLQLFNRDSLMEVDIFYRPGVTAEIVKEQVTKRLVARHGREDFTIVTQDDMLQVLDRILLILKYAAGGLGSISLLVGCVGIVTILMITVRERTREIGLLRALGMSQQVLWWLFISEAAVLSLLGALLGIVLAAMIIGIASFWLPLQWLWLEILVALFIAVLVGLLAGLWPAKQAASLNPVLALRQVV
ncbi:MAG: ABC transporter permease [Cellvibrionaceae bacterium]